MLLLIAIATSFASETSVESEPVVNPTVKYITEQFSAAIERGVPLASAGLQEICNQIQYLGIGLLVYDSLLTIMAIVAAFVSYKILNYSDLSDEVEQHKRLIFGIIIGALSCLLFLVGLDDVSEHITMTTAPMIWALQELM